MKVKKISIMITILLSTLIISNIKVKASVNNVLYDLDRNSNYFTFAAFGEPHGTTTQACYGGADINWNTRTFSTYA